MYNCLVLLFVFYSVQLFVIVVGVLGTIVLGTVEVVEDGAEVDADWNEIK